MKKGQIIVKNKARLAKVAKDILKLKPGIVALEGPLGAGKTALTKELAKLLGIKDVIVSPTFVLHRQYGVLNHIDCYRMDEFGELLQIGLLKMIENKSVIVIEWADKFKFQISNIKYPIIWVKIEYAEKENERKVSYENIGD